MQIHQQHVYSQQPRVFNHSLDWRFLLPHTDARKFFIIFEDDPDFNQTLEQIGIPVSNLLSFSDITQKERAHSLALPFGLPMRWVSVQQEEQIEFYRSIRRLIRPDGHLLIGFKNSRNFRSKISSKYYSSTPHRTAYQLHQAGFKSIRIFGAMPNLNIPEYIFDLDVNAIHFALHHRFKRKPAILNILQTLSRTISWAGISTFLPCYFAVAVA